MDKQTRASRPAPDTVEESSIESFPSSDPPSFTPVTGAGAPPPDAEGKPASVLEEENSR